MNKYILSTLMLALVCSGLFYLNVQEEQVDFGGIEIPSEDLDSILRPLPDGSYHLCEIDSGECVLGVKKSFGEE